jgi:hypothetical protein
MYSTHGHGVVLWVVCQTAVSCHKSCRPDELVPDGNYLLIVYNSPRLDRLSSEATQQQEHWVQTPWVGSSRVVS